MQAGGHNMRRVIGCATAQNAALVLMMVCLLFAASPAQAQARGKRMVLLIGNDQYQFERTLKNPGHDITLLKKVFEENLGFDTVVSKPNLTMANMSRAIDAFVKSADGKQIESVVFYFSGHGMMAENRENFLLPIDAQIDNDGPLAMRSKAVSATLVQEQLEKLGANVTLLILDACRDGPGKGKSGVKGLAISGGGDEVLVAYATKANAIAQDGDGLYSPYAEALAEALRQVDLPILKQLDNVSDAVRKKFPRQKPTRYGLLRTDAYLVPDAAARHAASAALTQGVTKTGLVPAMPVPNCDFCPEMVAIPGGSFMMGDDGWFGDEKPAHQVTVRAFMLSKYEVTQGQWKEVMGTNPSRFKDCGDTCPVESVSWDEAQAYVQKLNAKTGGKYRLPSEAEWEYAGRASGTGQWSSGNDEPQLGKYAWYSENSQENGNYTTHPVGLKGKNKFGLHDMHGNVWEWVEDCYHANYNGAPVDGSAWTKNCGGKEPARVLRGGGWPSPAQYARSACRSPARPSRQDANTGFRLALMSPGPAGQ
jgi:formylglycine-generating enzyme required for sulfatase activity